MDVLLIGCGYVGVALARRLVALGHSVVAVRRDWTGEGSDYAADESFLRNASRVECLEADITEASAVKRLPTEVDWVINSVSSSRGGADVYREVFFRATERLIDHFRQSRTISRYVMTSSTSVYGQLDGREVDETSETAPRSEMGRILVETEELLRNAHREHDFPSIILRLAGIYGPGRGYLFQQFVKGEAQLSGDGSRILNMIYRDDAVSAIIQACERGEPGNLYNVADDLPVSQREFFEWLAQRMDRPMPPGADPGSERRRKRPVTNKRVSNARIKADLGIRWNYPTFRHGYAEDCPVAAAGSPDAP